MHKNKAMGNTIIDQSNSRVIPTSLAPWLSVRNGKEAVKFYRAAFGAQETYRLEGPDESLIVKLNMDGVEFWISGESPGNDNIVIVPVGGGAIRMILTVKDPDALFVRALEAGAIQVFPIGEEHGWRIGRLVDPFGFHWEIGRPVLD
jgi:PhnB protein